MFEYLVLLELLAKDGVISWSLAP